LEWLAIVLYAYGMSGRWIAMLQDFQFKIIHRTGSRHLNVDALNWNLVGFLEKMKILEVMQWSRKNN
jgi:hypothetical protein